MADSEAQMQQIVDMLSESMYKEFAKAVQDQLIYGMGFFAVTEDGLKHIPIGELDEYTKLLPEGDDSPPPAGGGTE